MTVEIKPNWEERFARIKRLPIEVNIGVPGIEDLITETDEIFRVEEVLQLVSAQVAKDVQNMLKGVVKYVNGHHSVEEWLELWIDETADARNYASLFKAEYIRAKNEGESFRPTDIIDY